MFTGNLIPVSYTHLDVYKRQVEFNVAAKYFGITAEGNFVDHSHPQPLAGQNVLSIVEPKIAEADKILLASAKKKMSDARARRIRPHLDDKILASWNGLMLGAFARASAVLDDKKYRAAAEKNLQFIQEKLWDEKSKTLFHRWRDSERDSVQLLEAHAFLSVSYTHLSKVRNDWSHLC